MTFVKHLAAQVTSDTGPYELVRSPERFVDRGWSFIGRVFPCEAERCGTVADCGITAEPFPVHAAAAVRRHGHGAARVHRGERAVAARTCVTGCELACFRWRTNAASPTDATLAVPHACSHAMPDFLTTSALLQARARTMKRRLLQLIQIGR